MNNYSKTHLYKYMTCTTETQFIQTPKGHAKISELNDVCIEQAFRDNCQLIDTCFGNAQTKAYLFYATG